MGRNEDNAAKGDAAMKKAKSAKSKSVIMFKFSADWYKAAQYYREAIKFYSMAGEENTGKHVEALLASIEPHERIDDYHTCARSAEKAGTLIMEGKTSYPDDKAIFWFQQAFRWHVGNDEHDRGAKLLFKIAEMQQKNGDSSAAITTLNSIIESFDESERHTFGNESFIKCVSKAIEYGCHEDALKMMSCLIKIMIKVVETSGENTYENDIYKFALGSVILLLFDEKYEEAFEEFENGQDYHNYQLSKEWSIASAIVQAFQAGDREMLIKAQKATLLGYLPNRLARMARKLKISDELVSSPPGGPATHGAASDDDDNEDLGLG